MKNLVVLSVLFICASILVAGVKPATKDEVSMSIEQIQKFINEENENAIKVFSAALEIEKRATTSFFAGQIAQKMAKNSSMALIEKARTNFTFSQLAVIWAVAQLEKKPMKSVLDDANSCGIENLISGLHFTAEQIAEKILQLNPPKQIRKQ
jgi:hypothetical protein